VILEKELLAMIGSDEHPNIRHLAEGGSSPTSNYGIGSALVAAAGRNDFIFLFGIPVLGSGGRGSAGMEGPFGSGVGFAGIGGRCAKDHPGSVGRVGGEGSGGVSGCREEGGAFDPHSPSAIK
jgi:hypothetical protein